MIWRGNQYVRAIKLYYRKNGRFPKELDDLYKPKQGSLRFLRQPFKDPMNKTDGAWRLIYVGPADQLIGTLKPPTDLQLPVPNRPTAPGATAPGATSASGTAGTQSGAPASAGGGATTGATGTSGTGSATPGQPGSAGGDASGTSSTSGSGGAGTDLP